MRHALVRSGIAVCLIVGLALAGCDYQEALRELAPKPSSKEPPPTASLPSAQDVVPPVPMVGSGDTIRVASFNIQVFGTSKMGKPEVMDILALIVRRFDVVAIQEVRSSDQTVVPRFVDLVNAEGARYSYVLGPRLGRTSSKEQYAFVYDTARIEVQQGSVYTVEDPTDLLHREPLVARFRVRGPSAAEAFTFSLVNIHTDPDETDIELDALDDVFTAVQNNGSGEDDVILLGDLNVDDRHLGELGQLPSIAWMISGQPTNTRGTKSYDNIVFDRRATVEATGTGGVLDFAAEYGLSMEQALTVSDHLPVWAEFRVTEGNLGQRFAERPASVPR